MPITHNIPTKETQISKSMAVLSMAADDLANATEQFESRFNPVLTQNCPEDNNAQLPPVVGGTTAPLVAAIDTITQHLRRSTGKIRDLINRCEL